MQEVKRCERCYKIISRMESSDWYSHMRIKYCDECRPVVEKEQAAARTAAYRARKKAERAEQKETIINLQLEIEFLKMENENLRSRMAALMGYENAV